MSAERYLLDTSALLTFIEDEVGAGRVEEVLNAEFESLSSYVSLEALPYKGA